MEETSVILLVKEGEKPRLALGMRFIAWMRGHYLKVDAKTWSGKLEDFPELNGKALVHCPEDFGVRRRMALTELCREKGYILFNEDEILSPEVGEFSLLRAHATKLFGLELPKSRPAQPRNGVTVTVPIEVETQRPAANVEPAYVPPPRPRPKPKPVRPRIRLLLVKRGSRKDTKKEALSHSPQLKALLEARDAKVVLDFWSGREEDFPSRGDLPTLMYMSSLVDESLAMKQLCGLAAREEFILFCGDRMRDRNARVQETGELLRVAQSLFPSKQTA